MKAFSLVPILMLVGCAQAQYPGLWNGGIFNPWNNPTHPANLGLARGLAARNYFAWPAAPFIRNAAIPSAIANSPALNLGEVPEGQKALIDHLAEKKQKLDSRIREAAIGGAAFRPVIVNDLLKERMEIVRDIQKVQQEIVRDRLSIVAKRREIARIIAESNDPISFGLLMQSLNRVYGKELAEKNIALKRKIVEKFDKPFLRPLVSVFTPEGLPKDVHVETKIYQDLKEKKGTLLKGQDIYIITKLTGFTGDKLHLGVDFHGVNKTVSDAQALSEDFLQQELAFQSEILEQQMNLTEKFLRAQLEAVDKQSELQKKIMEKQIDKASKIAELVDRKQELELKLAKQQKKIVERQLEKEKKLLEKQAELEAKALEKQMDFGSKIAENQINKLVEKEFAQQQADFGQQQQQQQQQQRHIERGLEFLRQRLNFGGFDKESDLLQRQLEKAQDKDEKERERIEKLLEKEREKAEKQAEKEKDLIEKQLEKERDLIEKQQEKEAQAFEKQKELFEKQLEKEAQAAEKQRELLQNQLEKEQELAEKQLEKEKDLLEKQREKEAEKQKELLEKQKEKDQEQLEQEQEKAQELFFSLQAKNEEQKEQLEDSQSEEIEFAQRFIPRRRFGF